MDQDFLGAPYTCRLRADGGIVWNNMFTQELLHNPLVLHPPVNAPFSVLSRVNEHDDRHESELRAEVDLLVRKWFAAHEMDVLGTQVGVLMSNTEVRMIDYFVRDTYNMYAFWVYGSMTGHRPISDLNLYANALQVKCFDSYNVELKPRALNFCNDKKIRCYQL
eukprot:3934805-Rhodomonas_salina.4